MDAMPTTRFALLEYATANIGDEIQSLAASQFLPRVDYYINRDSINAFAGELQGETKLIMNGWYMHSVDWPPKSAHLTPLLTSMYVDQRQPRVLAAFASKDSIAFLREHGPVGTRDLSTLAYLQGLEIPSFFSGCLTLTLAKDPSVQRQDYILAVDVAPGLLDALRKQTSRPVIPYSVNHAPQFTRAQRFALARHFLYLYQSAHCVVTTRLHTTLPCLAFGTPALLINDSMHYDRDRFAGLAQLAHNASEDAIMKGSHSFDWETPPPNPEKHLPLRSALEGACLGFTLSERKQFVPVARYGVQWDRAELMSVLSHALSQGWLQDAKARDAEQRLSLLEASRWWRAGAPLRRVRAGMQKRARRGISDNQS